MGRIDRTRTYVQAGAALLQNSYFFKNLKFCPTPALNCYACPLAVTACPIGTLQNLILKGYLPLAILGFLITVGAAVGRAACGWACPFGFAQDLLGRTKQEEDKHLQPFRMDKIRCPWLIGHCSALYPQIPSLL